MFKKSLSTLTISAVFSMLLTGCDTNGNSPEKSTESSSVQLPAKAENETAKAAFITTYGLENKSVTEIVDYIDQLPQERPLPYAAGITATQLTLLDENKNEYIFPLGEKFYLSIAPYINYTHDCFNHSLSGCTAELVNKKFHVKVTTDSGEVLFNQTVTSFYNGFYGLWLPKNIKGTIEVSYEGRVASATFTTNDDSQTCMTTLKLNNKVI